MISSKNSFEKTSLKRGKLFGYYLQSEVESGKGNKVMTKIYTYLPQFLREMFDFSSLGGVQGLPVGEEESLLHHRQTALRNPTQRSLEFCFLRFLYQNGTVIKQEMTYDFS